MGFELACVEAAELCVQSAGMLLGMVEVIIRLSISVLMGGAQALT